MRQNPLQRRRGFTLTELLVVVLIIAVLTGLILSISSYAHTKGQMARAQSEIAAMSAALESYKADNGMYPENTATDTLNARTNTSAEPVASGTFSMGLYAASSQYLYGQLSGDMSYDQQVTAGAKVYMMFPPRMLMTKGVAVGYIVDPFGFSYGYSTAYQGQVGAGKTPTEGYNPTYDLWSTAGKHVNMSGTAVEVTWITNW